jgi:transposase
VNRKQILKACQEDPESIVILIESLLATIQRMEERVKTLENQLYQNSRNSSKPPSSDGFRKPKPKSLRVKGERAPGGQAGHKGHSLEFATSPDYIVVHRTMICSCGHNLEQEPVLRHEKRQVHDLPPSHLEVTEHQAEVKFCSVCSKTVKGEFPADVDAPVQYGPRFRATAIYLSQYQLLPYQRVGEVMEHLFQHKLSEGTLVNANLSLYEQLEPVECEIVEQIAGSAVAHFDETGMRVQGKTQWCHVASTDKLTHYFAHPKRGQEAMNAAGVLPNFQGTAVHDAWAPYFHYDHCHHALCNAHILRELIFVLEQEKQSWAKAMINLLLEAKTAIETEGTLSVDDSSCFTDRYDRILELGFMEDARQNPTMDKPFGKRGKPKQSKPKNLLDRLRDYRLSVLTFLYDSNVPFDNNQAERDVRMIKVKQKISGTFRSEQGARVFCRIRSYISTAKKNACSIIDAIQEALQGSPFMPSIQKS